MWVDVKVIKLWLDTRIAYRPVKDTGKGRQTSRWVMSVSLSTTYGGGHDGGTQGWEWGYRRTHRELPGRRGI